MEAGASINRIIVKKRLIKLTKESYKLVIMLHKLNLSRAFTLNATI